MYKTDSKSHQHMPHQHLHSDHSCVQLGEYSSTGSVHCHCTEHCLTGLVHYLDQNMHSCMIELLLGSNWSNNLICIHLELSNKWTLTYGWVSQLPADHLSISCPPQVTTHCAPHRVQAYLHSTFRCPCSSNKPQGSSGVASWTFVGLVSLFIRQNWHTYFER